MEAGRELDALVAEKVMGRTADPTRCVVCGWPLRPDVTLGCVPGNCAMRPAPLVRYDAVAPYSTDIAAAWTVVTKVMETAWAYEARQNHESRPRFAFTTADGMGFSREGDTISHAICLAALAALANSDVLGRPDDGGAET